MDGPRFDLWTKAFARTQSRRQAITALLGAAAAVGATTGRTSAHQQDCSTVCNFLPPGKDHGRCMADCAKAGGEALGPWCRCHFCAVGELCCNDDCGYCRLPNEGCTLEVCADCPR
ncbi:MAG: hypothetical protein M3R06_05010 [Chloroflexota bacterium]|nr:hypothetical protein [Chloroflexota bacterium]